MTTIEEFSSDSDDEDYIPGGTLPLCIVELLGRITSRSENLSATLFVMNLLSGGLSLALALGLAQPLGLGLDLASPLLGHCLLVTNN